MTVTMEKKEYIKPEITVIEVESQQIICASPGNEQEFGLRNADSSELDEFYGEFE